MAFSAGAAGFGRHTGEGRAPDAGALALADGAAAEVTAGMSAAGTGGGALTICTTVAAGAARTTGSSRVPLRNAIATPATESASDAPTTRPLSHGFVALRAGPAASRGPSVSERGRLRPLTGNSGTERGGATASPASR